MDAPVAIANYRTKLEAETAAGVLAAEKIPYLIQSGEGAMVGPLSPGATLFVTRENAERARTLLEESGLTPPEGR
jgi:hypothetical protein